MIIPAAMYIESAKDMLPSLTEFQRADQRREYREATGDDSDAGADAYELGLQTMRAVALTNPELIRAGLSKIL